MGFITSHALGPGGRQLLQPGCSTGLEGRFQGLGVRANGKRHPDAAAGPSLRAKPMARS